MVPITRNFAEGPGSSCGKCQVSSKDPETFAPNIIATSEPRRNTHLCSKEGQKLQGDHLSENTPTSPCGPSLSHGYPTHHVPAENRVCFWEARTGSRDPLCHARVEGGLDRGWRGGCASSSPSADQLGPDPVTAPSCNQSIFWSISWLCPWRPDGWNIRVRRVTNVMAGGIPRSLQEQRSWRQEAASLQLHPDMSKAENPAEKPRQSEETVRKE